MLPKTVIRTISVWFWALPVLLGTFCGMFLIGRIGLIGTLLVGIAVLVADAAGRRVIIEMVARAKLVMAGYSATFEHYTLPRLAGIDLSSAAFNGRNVITAGIRHWLCRDWKRLDYVTGKDAPGWLRWLAKSVLDLEQQWGWMKPIRVGETRTWFEHDKVRGHWYHCRQFIPRVSPLLDLHQMLAENALRDMAAPEDPAFSGTVRTAAESREVARLAGIQTDGFSGVAAVRCTGEGPIRGRTIDNIIIDDAKGFSAELEGKRFKFSNPTPINPDRNGDAVDPEVYRKAIQEFVGKKNDTRTRAELIEHYRQRYHAGAPIDTSDPDWVDENNYRVGVDFAKDVAEPIDARFLAAIDEILNTPPP